MTHVVQQQAGRHEPVVQRLMDVQTFKDQTPGKWRSRSKVAKIDRLLKQYHEKAGGQVDLDQKSVILDRIETECRNYQGKRTTGIQQLLEAVKQEKQVIECLKESLEQEASETGLEKLLEAKDEFLKTERQTGTKTKWLESLIVDRVQKKEGELSQSKFITNRVNKRQIPELEAISEGKDTPEIMKGILREILANKNDIYFIKGNPGADLLGEEDRQRYGKRYRIRQLSVFPEGSIEATSSLVHEMTHIAVQAKFENTPLHLAFKKEASKEDIKNLSQKRTQQLKELQQALEETNGCWTEGQKSLLKSKIEYPLDTDKLRNYAINFKESKKISQEKYQEILDLWKEGVNLTIIEFDSVINQMMYLMVAWHVNPDNVFYKKLHEIAQDAYNYRNP